MSGRRCLLLRSLMDDESLLLVSGRLFPENLVIGCPRL